MSTLCVRDTYLHANNQMIKNNKQSLGYSEGQRSWCVAVHDVGYNLATEKLPVSYFCFTPKCNGGPRGRSQTPPVCGVETQGLLGRLPPGGAGRGGLRAGT